MATNVFDLRADSTPNALSLVYDHDAFTRSDTTAFRFDEGTWYMEQTSSGDMPTMCGGRELQHRLVRTTCSPFVDGDRGRYCWRTALGDVHSQGIVVGIIECEDVAPLLRIAEILCEGVKETASNNSIAYAIYRHLDKYRLEYHHHAANDTCAEWALEDDYALCVDEISPLCEDGYVDYYMEPEDTVDHGWHQYGTYWEGNWREEERHLTDGELPRYLEQWITTSIRKPTGHMIISSSMGSDAPTTAVVLRYLAARKQKIAERYGYHIIAPKAHATNPNEGHHYIYSVGIVRDVIDTGSAASSRFWEHEYDEEEYGECDDGW